MFLNSSIWNLKQQKIKYVFEEVSFTLHILREKKFCVDWVQMDIRYSFNIQSNKFLKHIKGGLLPKESTALFPYTNPEIFKGVYIFVFPNSF